MKKLFLLLLAAMGVLSASLSGCGLWDDAPKRESVRVALWGNELLAGFAPYLCEKFPEVDFEFTLATNSTDYYRYLKEHDDLPDILTVRRFSLKDALFLKDSLYDLGNTEVAGTFYESYLASYTYADGSVYWLPACAEVDSIIVNKTLFEEHGIALPHDYASFAAACRAFEKKGIRGFISDYGSDYTCMETLQGFAIPNLTSMEGREWRMRYESGETHRLSREVWMPAFEKFFAMKEAAALGEAETRMRNHDPKDLYMQGSLAMYRGTGTDLMKFSGRPGDVSILLPYFAEDAGRNCYLTYPSFQVAATKKAMEGPAREKLLLDILTVMLSQEGQKRIALGKNMVPYNRGVTLELQSSLFSLKNAIGENRIYIRLASNEMFAHSRNVVQRILKGELRTPEEAFQAFNALLQQKEETPEAVAVLNDAYSNAFDNKYGSRAASALYNTIRAEAGVDLVLGQAAYAGNVYAGAYAEKDIRYLMKSDIAWLVSAAMTGEELFRAAGEMLRRKGKKGSVCNESTLYASSGFAMKVKKTAGGYELMEITVNGRPIDRKARFSVLILSDGDMFVPEILKDTGCTDFEVKRSVAAEYLKKRLAEKKGQLEEPTAYIAVE